MSEEKKHDKHTDPFIAIAHYAKNPVYILRGYLDALSSEDFGTLNEKQKKYIKICMENLERVSHTLEGLIRVLEIEEGHYEIKKEKVDIVKAVEDAIKDNLFLARATNTKISFVTEETSLSVLTDSQKIGEVISAFIDNAARYKNLGEGRAEIKIIKVENQAVCSIKDNGIGVPEEDKERIFRKFYRTEKAVEIDPNSLGLELYINKAIIEECGGSVWVEKNEEGGSTFYFTLPLYNENES